jgi:hypothetical protein
LEKANVKKTPESSCVGMAGSTVFQKKERMQKAKDLVTKKTDDNVRNVML